MARRSPTLWVLSLLAVAVAAAVWLDARRPGTEQTLRDRSRLAPRVTVAGALAFELERGGVRTRLERQGGAWWLVSPRRRADDAAVEAILSTLEFAGVERRVAAPDAALRAQAGVDRPRVVLTVGGLTLRLGADEPGGRGVYVERGGELLVAEHRLIEVAEASLPSLRPTLIDPGGASLVTVGALRLERAEGSWRLLAPSLRADGARAEASLRADNERVEALLAALAKARATRVLDLAGPSPSPSTGELLALDGVEQGRVLWQGCGNLPQESTLRRADGAILCFAADALAPLRVDVAALRERRLLPFTVDEVRAVDLRVGARTLSLRRQEHEWRLTAPVEDAAAADDDAVRAWLTELGRLRADVFAPPGRARGELRVATETDEVAVTLGDGDTALRHGEPSALRLPAALTALVDADPLRFRSRLVMSLRADDLDRVEIVEGARHTELRRSGERWLRAPDGMADAAAVGRLVAALADLRAERYLRRAFAPRRRVTVAPAADAGAPRTVELGPPEGDGCLARLAEVGAPVFVLPAATCAALASQP